jgi:hypothetical protein
VGGTIRAMASRPAKIELLRWIQPVGVPLIPIPASAIARPAVHAVFVLLAVIVVIDGLGSLPSTSAVVGETGSAASMVDANSRDACGQPLCATAKA